MDWLNETPEWSYLAPLLLWIKVLEICAVVLLVLAVLTLLIGWVRHLSLWVRLSALLPLAASMGAAIAVHSLHTSYVYLDNFITMLASSRAPFPLQSDAFYVSGTTTHTAMVLGWISMIVTGALLVLGLVGVWRLRGPNRGRQVSTSVVLDS